MASNLALGGGLQIDPSKKKKKVDIGGVEFNKKALGKGLSSGNLGAKQLQKLGNLGFAGDKLNELKSATAGAGRKGALTTFSGLQAESTAPKTDFTFQEETATQGGLPTVGEGRGTAGIRGASQDMIMGGELNLGAGGQGVGFGQGSLRDLLGQAGGAFGGQQVFSDAARQGSLAAEQQAFKPQIDEGLFNQRKQERIGEVNQIFGEGGAARDQLARNLANEVADLDALGVSGTSEQGVISNLIGDFARQRGAALQQAGELSRNEQLGERQDVRGLGADIAGLRTQESLGRGGLAQQFLGQGADIGQNIGALGLGQQQVGADLAKTGLGGLGQGVGFDIQQRGQEAELQQGEEAFRQNQAITARDIARRGQQDKYNKFIEQLLLGQLGLDLGSF